MKVFLVYAENIQTGEIMFLLGGGSSTPKKARVYATRQRAELHAPSFQPGRYDYEQRKYVRDPKWAVAIKEVSLP